MKIKQKIIDFLLIFLFITITYVIYYDALLNIISNNCNPIAGGLIRDDNSFLVNFINGYKKGENFICIGYFNGLLKNSSLTLTIYILFLWLTIIPFIFSNIKLNLKYKITFFISGVIFLTLISFFYILNTRNLDHFIGGY